MAGMRSLSQIEWCYLRRMGQSVAKLWAAMRAPLTKRCFELDMLIVLQ